MPKKSNEINETKNPTLIKPRQDVYEVLQKRIEIGLILSEKDIQSEADMDVVYKEKERWHEFNLEYLRHCFDVNIVAGEYEFSDATNLYINASFFQRVESFRSSVQGSINKLKSIQERLELYAEKCRDQAPNLQQSIPSSNKIFIVHGHNEALKYKVARFVGRLGLEEIILDEQPVFDSCAYLFCKV